MASTKVQIWDLPLRIFHWLLVLTVLAAYITGELGGSLSDWHGRFGGLALGLLIFRLIWGFIGGTHARFNNFFPTPSRVISYLRGQWNEFGHNPLGALSVFALLATLAALIGTGLFANDDIAFNGPLFNLVEKSQSDWLTGLHELAFNVLLILVILHIAAIAFYFFFKKKNLINPMITGKQDISNESKQKLTQKATRAGASKFIFGAAISSFIVWFVFSGHITKLIVPSQDSAAQTSTPNW
jgi:cytochrome b